eukprot:gene27147-32793_t
MHSFGLLPPWRNPGEYRPIAEDVEHQAPRNTGSTSNSTINLDGAIDPVKAGRLGLFFSLFVLSCFAVLALITLPTIPQEANSNDYDITPLEKGRHLFSRCHTHCKDECGHWKDEKGDVLCCDWSHGYKDAQMCPIYISPDEVCYCTNELQLLHEDSSFSRYEETNVDGEGDENGQVNFAVGDGGMTDIQGNNPELLHHRHKRKKDRNNDDDRNSISSEDNDDGDDDGDRRHHKRDKKDHHHDKKDKNHPDKPYPPPSPLPFPKDGKPSGSRMKFDIKIDPKDLPKRGDLPSKKEIKEKVDPVLDEIRDAIDKVHERIDGEIRDIK